MFHKGAPAGLDHLPPAPISAYETPFEKLFHLVARGAKPGLIPTVKMFDRWSGGDRRRAARAA
jgi:hypothetical protein